MNGSTERKDNTDDTPCVALKQKSPSCWGLAERNESGVVRFHACVRWINTPVWEHAIKFDRRLAGKSDLRSNVMTTMFKVPREEIGIDSRLFRDPQFVTSTMSE